MKYWVVGSGRNISKETIQPQNWIIMITFCRNVIYIYMHVFGFKVKCSGCLDDILEKFDIYLVL